MIVPGRLRLVVIPGVAEDDTHGVLPFPDGGSNVPGGVENPFIKAGKGRVKDPVPDFFPVDI